MRKTYTLPTFFLGGAPKSGTTTLHYVLARHPEIYMSQTKEPHFFDTDSNYARGLHWYAAFFDKATHESAVGESTAEYLCYANVAERIAEVIPEAQFIFLLRNPIDRSYSAYWHAVRYGRERASFEDAIIQEPKRVAQDQVAYRYNAYVSRGHYHRQLEKFMQHFDRSRILIMILEEFLKAPTDHLGEVARFLSVRPGRDWLKHAITEHRNMTKIPRSVGLQGCYPFLSKTFPIVARALLRLNTKNDSYPPMPERVRRKLVEEFKESNRELEKLLGRRLPVWEDKLVVTE